MLVNGLTRVPVGTSGLSGALFSSTWRPTIPTAYRSLGQPRFSLGVFCGVCISWPFPSQKCSLAVTGLRPFPGPGHFHSVFSVVFVFVGRFLRKNKAWRSRVSVHSLGGGRGALRKPIPLGVSCGLCYFWAVSIAKIRLGGLPNRNHLST